MTGEAKVIDAYRQWRRGWIGTQHLRGVVAGRVPWTLADRLRWYTLR